MTFYQGCNVAVLCTAQQIAFPMPRNRSVFRFRRSFPDRDGIDDLPPGLSTDHGMSRAAHAPLRPQVVHQLFFQYSPRLNEQATVNRLVGHSHAPVVGILGLQPPGNLFRRPVQDQFTRNPVSQLAVHGQKAALGAQRRVPSLVIRLMSAIGRTATMAGDFPAHRGGRPIEATSDLANRRTGSDPSRDVLSLRQCEYSWGATTGGGRNPSARQQQTANGAMGLVKGATNLMQRLSRLPSPPDVALLDRRKPKSFPWPHITPPLE